MLSTVLLVFAFVCEVLATFGVPSAWFNLGWAGLAFYFASVLFH
jgi:hypothetical protein